MDSVTKFGFAWHFCPVKPGQGSQQASALCTQAALLEPYAWVRPAASGPTVPLTLTRAFLKKHVHTASAADAG